MLSTPPAITISKSPDLIPRAAIPTASIPEAHKRFMVMPGTSIGRPASNVAMRATLRLSSPAWFAQPKMTSSMLDQSTCGLRAMSAAMGVAAKSSVRTEESEPP